MNIEVLGEKYDLEHLSDLIQAEKDGRILPCKPGDDIFEVFENLPIPAVRKVNKISTSGHGFYVYVKNIRTGKEYILCSDNLGKTWFLSRKEAEAALEA